MKGLGLILLLLVASPGFGATLWTEKNGSVELDPDVALQLKNKQAVSCELTVDGKLLTLDVRTVGTSPLEVDQLRGRFRDAPSSFLVLCRVDGATAAVLQTPNGEAFKMDSSSGALRLQAIDAMRLGSCGGGLAPEDLPRFPGGPHPTVMPLQPGNKSGPVADDGSLHDVLIAYTPRAEEVMGGTAEILAEAQLAVDVANLTYDNSLIASHLRLVHVVETPYDELAAWNYSDHVNFLYDPNDGHMDELLPLRDLVGADFLSVLVDGRNTLGEVPTCGIAPVMSADYIQPSFEAYAISVVSVQCASSVWSFAHEVGHNRGCAHNRENTQVPGAYDYSYGHRFEVGGSGFRTVMAYDTNPPEFARIPYFSNPDVDWIGAPTGVPVGWAGEAHNSRTQNQTATLCAAFRAERTFVQFGWSEPSTGLMAAPIPTIAEAVLASRRGGSIALLNGSRTLTGTFTEPNTLVSAASGSVVLGGN